MKFIFLTQGFAFLSPENTTLISDGNLSASASKQMPLFENIAFGLGISAVIGLLVGLLCGLLIARLSNKEDQRAQNLQDTVMTLQGHLDALRQEAAGRDTKWQSDFTQTLGQMQNQVRNSLSETQKRTDENLGALNERLSIITQAQDNIKNLSTEVHDLQRLLSDKQTRGAFGEQRMQDLLTDCLAPSAYDFQVTLSNNCRVDALIHMPDNHGHIAIDSKFPMEGWRKMQSAQNDTERNAAKKEFAAMVNKHIDDIASKYLTPSETYEIALLFLPSEAIFNSLHSEFDLVIEKSFRKKVMIVSPTSLMSILHTVNAVKTNADMRENIDLVQKEVGILVDDVKRLSERAQKLKNHFQLAEKDIDGVLTSVGKITKRGDKIVNVKVADTEKLT